MFADVSSPREVQVPLGHEQLAKGSWFATFAVTRTFCLSGNVAIPRPTAEEAALHLGLGHRAPYPDLDPVTFTLAHAPPKTLMTKS